MRIGRQSNLIKHKTTQFLENLMSGSECIQIDANFSSKLAKLLNSEKKNVSRPHLAHKRRNEATSTTTATATMAQAVPFPSEDGDGDDDPEGQARDVKNSQDVIPVSGRRNVVYLGGERSEGHVATRKVIVRTSSESWFHLILDFLITDHYGRQSLIG